MTNRGVLYQYSLLGEIRPAQNSKRKYEILKVEMEEKQVCSGTYAADGAGSWYTDSPVEIPATPSKRLKSRLLVLNITALPLVTSK